MEPFILEVVSTQAEMKFVYFGVGGGGAILYLTYLNR